jgi:hypothetical protein
MQLLSGDRLKQVLTTVMAALVGGCASFAPYVPVEDGQPFATLVVPSRITSWRPGSVGSTTLNFAIANEQGCGNFVKPEPATQERSEVRYKIPINKDILIGYARDSGVMTCNVSASFHATTAGAQYVLNGRVLGMQCALTVSEITAGSSTLLPLEPAFRDAWIGRKACKRRQDL